jgi:Fe2+ transport system protein B
MAQRLCKLSRHDITASLSDIHRIVAAPKYLCRSCARSSSDKKRLCKPEAFSVNAPVAKESTTVDKSSKAALKVAKKTLKAQKKYQKKLEKVLKKQRKLAKKQQALQLKFAKLNQATSSEYSLTSQYH